MFIVVVVLLGCFFDWMVGVV